MTKSPIDKLDRMPEEIASSPEVAAIWKECLPSFDRAKVGKPSQSLAVAYCRAIWLVRKAMEDLDKEGITLRGPRGKLSANPSCRVWSTASGALLDFANRLGLTPEKMRKRLAEESAPSPPRDTETRAPNLLDFVEGR